MYTLATFAGIAVVAIVALLISFAIGVGAAAVGATSPASHSTASATGDALAGAAGDLCAWGGRHRRARWAGLRIATLARSQLAGIGVGIGVYFAGTFAAVFLPDLVKYLPFQLSIPPSTQPSGGGGFGGGGGPATSVSADLALLLLGVWLVGSLVVAAGFTERAEITG